MTLSERMAAFVELGRSLKPIVSGHHDEGFVEMSRLAKARNAWFTEEEVMRALTGIIRLLDEKELIEWQSRYVGRTAPARNVAVIMAGNIPASGFHDFLCVLVAGHQLQAKLSTDDAVIIPWLYRRLTEIEPRFAGRVQFAEREIRGMDAVIATGSNNSARYFEHYFGRFPHIIRKNRNSAAILTGRETAAELQGLGHDIFDYFGMGCRSVSKLFVPIGYDFNHFFGGIAGFSHVANHHKYINNYDYNRTVYLMSGDPSLLDNNFLLIREDRSLASPIGVLFYEYYESDDKLEARLAGLKEELQCVCGNESSAATVNFGHAQRPGPGEYADGVDTMEFLLTLR